MSRFEIKSRNERIAIWIRQYILGINITNTIGGLLTQYEQGFVGIIQVATGTLAIPIAFNKKLNVTFLNKRLATINFIVGAITLYISFKLIYTTIYGG